MPLTDAERAKRYREKKKQRDPSFIEKERKRQQMQRVPRGEMAPNRLLSAGNKCAGYKKTAKERRKTAENIESTVCDTATQDQPQTMIVTLPALNNMICFALEMSHNCCSVLINIFPVD